MVSNRPAHSHREYHPPGRMGTSKLDMTKVPRTKREDEQESLRTVNGIEAEVRGLEVVMEAILADASRQTYSQARADMFSRLFHHLRAHYRAILQNLERTRQGLDLKY